MLLKKLYIKLQGITAVNIPVRVLWKFIIKNLPSLFNQKLLYRWRVSGVLKLKVEHLTFQYYSKCDDGVADALYYDARHFKEYHDLKLFIHLAALSKNILDVGANTGIYSVLAALSNPASSIIALEPYAVNAARLAKNLQLNNISTVTIVPKAAGDTDTVISFTVPEKEMVCDVLSANESFTQQFYRGTVNYKNVQVEQVTLDHLADTHGLTDVNLVKIDVESYEIPVFKGAHNLLQKYSPLILCEIFVDDVRDSFYSTYLKPMGYYFYMHQEEGIMRIENLIGTTNSRNFIFSKHKTKNDFTPYSDMNALCRQLLGIAD